MSSTKLPSPGRVQAHGGAVRKLKIMSEENAKKKNYAILTRNTKPVTRNFS